jgi:hypothetical protein
VRTAAQHYYGQGLFNEITKLIIHIATRENHS